MITITRIMVLASVVFTRLCVLWMKFEGQERMSFMAERISDIVRVGEVRLRWWVLVEVVDNGGRVGEYKE